MLVLCNASASSCTGQVFKIAAPPKQSQACSLPPARGICIPVVRIFVRSSTDRGAAQATGSQVSPYLGPEHRDGGHARLRPCRAGMCGTPQTFWQCYDSGCLGLRDGLGKGAGHDDSEEQVNKGSAGRAAPGAGCGLAPFRCVHSIVRFGSKLHRQHRCAGPAGPPTALNATDTFATLATLVSTRSGNARHVELARGD